MSDHFKSKSAADKLAVEEDPFEATVKKTGCLELHYKVQECMYEHRDWRKCKQEVADFRSCFELYQKNKANAIDK